MVRQTDKPYIDVRNILYVLHIGLCYLEIKVLLKWNALIKCATLVQLRLPSKCITAPHSLHALDILEAMAKPFNRKLCLLRSPINVHLQAYKLLPKTDTVLFDNTAPDLLL